MEDHAEKVACDDCADEWLIACRIERRGLGRKKYKLDDGAKSKENYRAADEKVRVLVWCSRQLPRIGS